VNILLSTIGRRSYIADYFKRVSPEINVVGTTDRHGLNSEFTVGLLGCDRRFIVPSIESKDYIAAVFDICRKEKVGMICSLFDKDCHVLADYLDSFHDKGVVPFIPDRRISDICFDKVLTVQFLGQIGIGSPATFTSIEDFRASNIAYPVVVKPRFGFASLNMFLARCERELIGCFDPEVHIIQEVLEGLEYSFDILNDLDGEVVSCVVKRKLKMRAGETDQAVTVKDSKLLDLAVLIGEAMGQAGPLDVDLFVSSNRIDVLEFNPRFGGGYPLSHAAGARFPELMVEMAKGKRPDPIIGEYQEDIVMMKDINVITRPLQSLVNCL
jgi:carbamoyl-phosphate synthase large subunit